MTRWMNRHRLPNNATHVFWCALFTSMNKGTKDLVALTSGTDYHVNDLFLLSKQ